VFKQLSSNRPTWLLVRRWGDPIGSGATGLLHPAPPALQTLNIVPTTADASAVRVDDTTINPTTDDTAPRFAAVVAFVCWCDLAVIVGSSFGSVSSAPYRPCPADRKAVPTPP